MTSDAMFVISISMLPALGLATWAWHAMSACAASAADDWCTLVASED